MRLLRVVFAILLVIIQCWSQDIIVIRRKVVASGGSGGLPATDAFASGSALNSCWTVQTGSFAVGSGIVTVTNSSEGSMARRNGTCETFTANQYSQMVISQNLASSQKYLSVGVRMTGSGGTASGYLLQTDGSDVSILEITNGSEATLATCVDSFAVGNTMRLEITGTTLVAKKNGTAMSNCTSVSDASFASGNPGIGGYSISGATASPGGDDWQADNL